MRPMLLNQCAPIDSNPLRFVELPIKTHTHIFPPEEANNVLKLLKQGKINGAAVLKISSY
ncbi:MAG: hypothetical protein C4527_06590 [Candidatus Omnitrophota bacterium]|jgi:D-arabinose 1-dehydrogenase-like Zn-dependent alcohol dehydrogenase|nr:MAG: hypothetical protein C4527_06590 [Candidatus Omnitrophota bacterium]